MSAGGFGAAGLLQGFAQSYTDARIRKTKMEADQRHQLSSMYIAMMPNLRPEAQMDAANRLMQIYLAKPGKKIDKKLSDFSTLGRDATQQNMGATAQANAPSGAMPQPGAAPPPTPDVSGAAGGTGAPPQVGGAMAPPPISQPIPPPPDLANPAAGYSPLLSPDEKNREAAAHIRATEGAKVSAELDARKAAADVMGLTGSARENFIAGRMLTPFTHWQQKMYTDPDNPGQPRIGFLDPLTHRVVDESGTDLENPQPWITAVNSPSTPFRATLQAGLSQGRSIAEILNEYNTRMSSINGVRMVQQLDGSIRAVPVTTTTSTQIHGAIPTPPGTPQAKSAGGGGGTGGGVRGAGTVVGGKIPAEVDKAQTNYQHSVSRYNMMADALPKALAGDQQAMLVMLYNHIGMTIGLQKGARITQDVINEAQRSAPWMATLLARVGVGNEFTMTPDLLRGIALAPEQMHQMVDNAESRLGQDYREFKDIQQYHASGGSGIPAPPGDITAGAKARNAKPGAPAAATSPKAGPKKGDTRSYQGHPYKFDGTQWVAQ